jgi:uncharacterized membrane protein YraQ (UPF0718 family)
MNNEQLFAWIFKITVSTLSAVVFAVVVVLLFGLFQSDVDNDKIFDIIGPAFSTVIGAFVGLLGGLSLNKGKGCDKKDEGK